MTEVPMPAASAAGAARGPVGETRSVGLSILWMVLTLGIFAISRRRVYYAGER